MVKVLILSEFYDSLQEPLRDMKFELSNFSIRKVLVEEPTQWLFLGTVNLYHGRSIDPFKPIYGQSVDSLWILTSIEFLTVGLLIQGRD